MKVRDFTNNISCISEGEVYNVNVVSDPNQRLALILSKNFETEGGLIFYVDFPEGSIFFFRDKIVLDDQKEVMMRVGDFISNHWLRDLEVKSFFVEKYEFSDGKSCLELELGNGAGVYFVFPENSIYINNETAIGD